MKKIAKYLNKNFAVIAVAVMMMAFMSFTAFGSGADTLWTTISGLIQTWVTRLGGVIIFVGGIMFGLGWKNEDADGKSRGIQTMIGGAIVFALAELTGIFFA